MSDKKEYDINEVTEKLNTLLSDSNAFDDYITSIMYRKFVPFVERYKDIYAAFMDTCLDKDGKLVYNTPIYKAEVRAMILQEYINFGDQIELSALCDFYDRFHFSEILYMLNVDVENIENITDEIVSDYEKNHSVESDVRQALLNGLADIKLPEVHVDTDKITDTVIEKWKEANSDKEPIKEQ